MGFGQQLWTRSRRPGSLRLVVLWRPGSCIRGIQRQYSTHNSLNMDFGNSNSSLLKGASGAGRASEHKHDHVGPFQLGLSPSALRQGEKIPKWSELSMRDKGTFCIIPSRIFQFGYMLICLDSHPFHRSYNKLWSHTPRCRLFCAFDLLSHIGTLFEELAYRAIWECL